jgi:hypothetical protein
MPISKNISYLLLTPVAQDVAADVVGRLRDRAPWPTAGTRLVPATMRFLPQPAASPALHSTALVWRERRDTDRPNHAYEPRSRVEDDLCTG